MNRLVRLTVTSRHGLDGALMKDQLPSITTASPNGAAQRAHDFARLAVLAHDFVSGAGALNGSTKHLS